MNVLITSELKLSSWILTVKENSLQENRSPLANLRTSACFNGYKCFSICWFKLMQFVFGDAQVPCYCALFCAFICTASCWWWCAWWCLCQYHRCQVMLACDQIPFLICPHHLPLHHSVNIQAACASGRKAFVFLKSLWSEKNTSLHAHSLQERGGEGTDPYRYLSI